MVSSALMSASKENRCRTAYNGQAEQSNCRHWPIATEGVVLQMPAVVPNPVIPNQLACAQNIPFIQLLLVAKGTPGPGT